MAVSLPSGWSDPVTLGQRHVGRGFSATAWEWKWGRSEEKHTAWGVESTPFCLPNAAGVLDLWQCNGHILSTTPHNLWFLLASWYYTKRIWMSRHSKCCTFKQFTNKPMFPWRPREWSRRRHEKVGLQKRLGSYTIARSSGKFLALLGLGQGSWTQCYTGLLSLSSTTWNLGILSLWELVEFCRQIGIPDPCLLTSPCFFGDPGPLAGGDCWHTLTFLKHTVLHATLCILSPEASVEFCLVSPEPRPLCPPWPLSSPDGGPNICATNQTGLQSLAKCLAHSTFCVSGVRPRPPHPASAVSWSQLMKHCVVHIHDPSEFTGSKKLIFYVFQFVLPLDGLPVPC